MCVYVEVKDVHTHTQTHTSALLHLLRIASTGDIVSANDSS